MPYVHPLLHHTIKFWHGMEAVDNGGFTDFDHVWKWRSDFSSDQERPSIAFLHRDILGYDVRSDLCVRIGFPVSVWRNWVSTHGVLGFILFASIWFGINSDNLKRWRIRNSWRQTKFGWISLTDFLLYLYVNCDHFPRWWWWWWWWSGSGSKCRWLYGRRFFYFALNAEVCFHYSRSHLPNHPRGQNVSKCGLFLHFVCSNHNYSPYRKKLRGGCLLDGARRIIGLHLFGTIPRTYEQSYLWPSTDSIHAGQAKKIFEHQFKSATILASNLWGLRLVKSYIVWADLFMLPSCFVDKWPTMWLLVS